jgi:hypothetical protein
MTVVFRLVLLVATAFAAIFDVFPVLFPLFTPGEGLSAHQADFRGEGLFFVGHVFAHRDNDLIIIIVERDEPEINRM